MVKVLAWLVPSGVSQGESISLPILASAYILSLRAPFFNHPQPLAAVVIAPLTFLPPWRTLVTT
jgi:hypothetical protein